METLRSFFNILPGCNFLSCDLDFADFNDSVYMIHALIYVLFIVLSLIYFTFFCMFYSIHFHLLPGCNFLFVTWIYMTMKNWP